MTIMTELTDIPMEEELAQIKRFKRQVMVKLSGNYPPLNQSQEGVIFPEVRGETSNRGNKLLQHADAVTYSKLREKEHGSKVFYNGAEHKLLSRKRMKFNNGSHRRSGKRTTADTGDESEDSADYSDGDNDLNNLVAVKEILSPISSLKDVIQHPSHSRTFGNQALKELALSNVLMVEKEQENVINYSKLLEIFLGDFPDALYEDALKLPEYDHKLTFKEEDDENYISASSNSKSIKPEDEEAFFGLSKFTESETLLSLIPKHFHTGDMTVPISNEISDDIETTRQLAQIALQRNQEFIRNLQKIRNCIIKANRIRERILMWGKEFAGISEKGVTIPNALHVVKRGLISATTNQTQLLGAEESDNEE
ncbi:Rxt2p [Kluyveromyces lactis]|uniref:KLLA0B11990p n=1 Tax=Kluyveromyces lactis (strain ATCC 8585 / CBS 2359 / DSM 70799 / NBRC 1267 / NRRL Y-1140 / WM37) TaxID=284590 RepID=Q6CVH6_KLULA|nr:uncharacterized protein KLLA0_B11990g [Kluyveromyces lactis]CAH02456.1 KLLA0B11990p [Kluyveromyces lactis]|eukprot:XP_452063.1 uncharacterized protein KLLA0_B11990g [Kluyveromyces lactis]